jgi:predicted aldo/keto reductase-like oxidoreductase
MGHRKWRNPNKHPFGKTGVSFPILSFGGQRIVDEHNCTEKEAVEIVNTAIDRGIRYFDTTWIYSQGQAETHLDKVARHRRAEMWIATKTWNTTRDGARRQLQKSLGRLQTDYVDEWRLHNVWDYARLNAFTGPGGALEAAVQAREEGLVRRISISGHTDPQILVEALNRLPFDSALITVSETLSRWCDRTKCPGKQQVGESNGMGAPRPWAAFCELSFWLIPFLTTGGA